jgi:hypothetical protein
MTDIRQDPEADHARARARWRKSRISNPSGNCVELAWAHPGEQDELGQACADHPKARDLPGGEVLYLMRDSRDPAGPVLAYTFEEMAAFLESVKDGEFDDFLKAGL